MKNSMQVLFGVTHIDVRFKIIVAPDYEMKMRGWSTRQRWEWEKTRDVVVFSTDDSISQEKHVIIKELEEVLGEFSIPLGVIDGNLEYSKDVMQILALLDSSIKSSEIDCEEFENELHKVREKGRLPYGVVVIIDKTKYEFYQPPKLNERAIYGWGVPDGLVLLRFTHREALRHEFGHMLGLGIHHKECVMDYKCITPAFCSDCKQQIEEMWQEEIKYR